MSLTLSIPESIDGALRLPEPEKEPRLRLELAFGLYTQGILPFGKARDLAGMGKREFGLMLGERGIARHYGEDDLDADLSYARGQ